VTGDWISWVLPGAVVLVFVILIALSLLDRRAAKHPLEPVTKVDDMRKPGEPFCSECPDHEACMSGYPCWWVQDLHQTRRNQ
jgi:hypothetical protein